MTEQHQPVWPTYVAAPGYASDVQDLSPVAATAPNTKATVALIFGVMSIAILPLALANLILAPIALNEIAASGGRESGRPQAVAGLVLAVGALLLAGLFWLGVVIFLAV